MKLAVRRTSAAIAAVATAGVSSIFFGAAPAFAATEACPDGNLVAPGICELTFTTGTATFTPTSQMTQLEVLLVGAGGSSTDGAYTSPGYAGAAAGGGGEVKIVDFAGATAPLAVVVPVPGTTGSVTSGSRVETVGNGADGVLDSPEGSDFGARGGASGATTGAGNPGAFGGNASATPYAAGGGAGSAATSNADGGAGVAVSTIAAGLPGSLFTGVGTCYGGGGAASTSTVQGIPGCGAGRSDATGATLIAPDANSGGGAGAIEVTQTLAQRQGASGVIVVRYTAANVTLAFAANGHGVAPASQSVVPGTAPTKPTDPTATGFAFKGWYTDAQLTTPVDFSAAITGSTTFYASWAPALAATGVTPTMVALPIGLAALFVGAGLFLAGRRKRTGN